MIYFMYSDNAIGCETWKAIDCAPKPCARHCEYHEAKNTVEKVASVAQPIQPRGIKWLARIKSFVKRGEQVPSGPSLIGFMICTQCLECTHCLDSNRVRLPDKSS